MTTEGVPWLTRLQADLEAITTAAANEIWTNPAAAVPYYNYRFEHVAQVARDARRLQARLGGDLEVLLAAVWLHDRFQPQFEGPDHGQKAAEWAAQHLAGLSFPPAKVPAVCHAVAVHSNPPGTIPTEAQEARLLWDADKLTRVGPLSLAAYLLAAPAFPEDRLTYAELARRALSSLESLQARVDEFYFDLTRAWARARFQSLTAFIQALALEVGLP